MSKFYTLQTSFKLVHKICHSNLIHSHGPCGTEFRGSLSCHLQMEETKSHSPYNLHRCSRTFRGQTHLVCLRTWDLFQFATHWPKLVSWIQCCSRLFPHLGSTPWVSEESPWSLPSSRSVLFPTIPFTSFYKLFMTLGCLRSSVIAHSRIVCVVSVPAVSISCKNID